MRILGIDFGDARVGVAVTDPLGITAQGVGTIQNTGMKKLVSELSEIIEEYKPETIVIGMPKNMDGTEGFRADKTYKFADKLKKVYNGEIVFVDERLTTVGASQFLNVTNTRGQKRKDVIDTVSSCLKLETYMNKKNRG